MKSYRDIYERFIKNYRTETGGINLYPQFDYDLEKLLTYLEEDLNSGTMDMMIDCGWMPSVEED